MFALEFSFDRARDNQRDTEKDTHQSDKASPNLGPRPGPDLNTVDPSTIANERLRKAIERNRAKQAERDAQAPRPNFAPPPRPNPEVHEQKSFFNRTEEPLQDKESTKETTRETSREAPPLRPTSVVRRSVAKPEDAEFVPVKRTTRKVASQINYTTSNSTSGTRKKAKTLDPKYTDYLVKACWVFCGIMILRLIFATGGVTDYYDQKQSLNERSNELKSIKNENMQLVMEIERMRSDIGYQKKLVRDNLGFIASDEFLVLFPKEK